MWEPEITKMVFVKEDRVWVPLKKNAPRPLASNWKERWVASIRNENGSRLYVASSISYWTTTAIDFAADFRTRRGATAAAREAAKNQNSFDATRNPTWEKV